MARPKSEEKRSTILEAAIDLFAVRGVWSTPTSAISQAAGVAEGTLFTYFPTKEELLNELYRELKSELAEVLLATYPLNGTVRDKFKHIWDHYVRWGVANPDKLKVMAQLRLSDQITPASHAFGEAPFAELERTARDAIARGELRDYPVELIAAISNALSETTLAVVATQGDSSFDYCAAGFEIFWRGIVNN